MARMDVYVCDECGVQKMASNHWWLAYLVGWKKLYERREEPTGISAFSLTPWSEDVLAANAHVFVHLCGQSCVIAAVNRFMSSGKLEK